MASFRYSNASRFGLGTLEHTGVAISPCFWLISPLSLGTSGTCSLHGSSVSACTSSPKGCCLSSCWKRNRSVLLGLHLPLPQIFGECKLLPGLSQRVAMGSTALLSAGLRRHRDNVGSALLLDDPRRAAAILAVSLGSP